VAAFIGKPLERGQMADERHWPRISIVTPSYNQAQTLEATIRSVLDQGYPNLEYLVLDGGSDDGSAAIIGRYGERLAFWRSAPDPGPYHAVDEGLRRSTGEIMGWLNADDLLHPGSLWTLGEVFATFPRIEWLMGNPSYLDARGRTVYVGEAPRWSRYRYLRRDFRFIQQESVAWRRSLWDRAGGRIDTSYSYAADLELWTRFFRHAQLYTTPALIGGFRAHSSEQRSAAHFDDYLSESERILASEPVSEAERRRLGRIGLFQKSIMAIPMIRSARWARSMNSRLFLYPPMVVYRGSEFRLEDSVDPHR
jgi:glycosyltransferase involved in cell wall biosynthesis